MIPCSVLTIAAAMAAASLAPSIGKAQTQQTAVNETHPADSNTLLSRRVTMNVRGVSLRKAVDVAAASAKVFVQYNAQALDAYTQPVTLRVTDESLDNVLTRLLAGTSLRVIADGPTQLGIVGRLNEAAAEGIITGTVVDADTKRPLSGAAVLLDDSQKGVTTAADGTFRMTNVKGGDHRVSVRLLGYGKLTARITVVDGETATHAFVLQRSTNVLDQVVVTGTVVATELKAVPNAITVITAKEIEQRGITHIDQLFRGDVPGLYSLNQGTNGSALDGEVTMFSRGATALTPESVNGATFGPLTNTIKTYIDGVEMANSAYLSQIDPRTIERVEILTGPQASTIYGSNAINGVMQIFTKRGTTNHPQLKLNLQSGWVENNFSPARTPQHDYSAHVSGIDGHASYNGGTSWNYMGPWSPAKQTSRLGVSGGARLDFATSAGRITTDVSLRRDVTTTVEHASPGQLGVNFREIGLQSPSLSNGVRAPTYFTLTGQTLGFSTVYAPTSWWSNEVGVGSDVSGVEQRRTAPSHSSVSDTAQQLQETGYRRRSQRYATTVRLPLTSMVNATVIVGGDAWQTLSDLWSVSPQRLTGNLQGYTYITRNADHNAGAFLQSQVGVQDRVFLTYGLRAEWNPSFGADALPNYAPRYGIAYTQEVGPITAKLRASYGQSTRPPQADQKVAHLHSEVYPDQWPSLGAYIKPFDVQIGNPELEPEYQKGGEGGIELYFGTHGSLVVTRYNQTVNNLISSLIVDTARTDVACDPNCYGNYSDAAHYVYFFQNEFLNIGGVRNQGWELQGTLPVGPFTTRGTYSWTKSRSLGMNPKYRSQFNAIAYPQYQPGATFNYLPEHTWAFGVTYTRQGSTVSLNFAGQGRTVIFANDFAMRYLFTYTRLSNDRWNMNGLTSMQGGTYVAFNRPYALGDLNASQRFSDRVEGVIQVQNLANKYYNDNNAFYASMGRQMKGGFRINVQ